MRYPGGKNGAGTWQRIVNQIPPHGRYFEPFVGSGAVLRHKQPAAESWALDLDPGALDAIREAVPANTHLIRANAIDWLDVRLRANFFMRDDFVYMDPPYLLETRRSGPMYQYEMTRADHERLLHVACLLPCRVMISGYFSLLYSHTIDAWRTVRFEVVTRGGSMATEWLWMNYAEPVALHDYRWLGQNFREREKFGRQRKRWLARLRRMDVLHRRSLLAAIEEYSHAENGERAGGLGEKVEAGLAARSVLGGNSEPGRGEEGLENAD